MCVKLNYEEIVQGDESLDLVHTHNHCQEIFAHMHKVIAILLNGGLIILTSNRKEGKQIC